MYMLYTCSYIILIHVIRWWIHYKKTAAYWRKKSSVCRQNNVIPMTYQRNKSSEITLRKFIFYRKIPTEFRENEFLRKLQRPLVRRKGPRNIPRENFLEIFRWNFRWSNSRKFRRNVPQNFHREFPRNGALGKFRGTCPSVYSEEVFPRKIPRKRSSEISEGSFPRNFKIN